jgi:hypothetical protein
VLLTDLIASMNPRQRHSRLDVLSDFDEVCQTDLIVDTVIGAAPAAAQFHHRQTQRPAIDARDIARLRCGNRERDLVQACRASV